MGSNIYNVPLPCLLFKQLALLDCNSFLRFTQLGFFFIWILLESHNSFPRITVIHNSFPRITDIHNSFPRIAIRSIDLHNSFSDSISFSRSRITIRSLNLHNAIREIKLCKLRKRFTNPRERSSFTIRFNVFENPFVPSELSNKVFVIQSTARVFLCTWLVFCLTAISDKTNVCFLQNLM